MHEATLPAISIARILRAVFVPSALLIFGGCGGTDGPPETPCVERIVFTSDRSGARQIHWVRPDGTLPTQVTTGGLDPLFPAVSADGTRILFISSQTGDLDIYVMNADGSNVANVTNRPSDDITASWTPDGRIAFSSNREEMVQPVADNGRFKLFVMNADGTGVTKLPRSTGADEYAPIFSPDGSGIAYTTDRDGGDLELYVMNVDGSGRTRLTNSAGNKAQPAWSPDGTRILFRHVAESEIYVIGSNGLNLVNITNDPAQDSWAAWSLDGTQVVFTSKRTGDFEVFIGNADGTGALLNLTGDAASSDGVSRQCWACIR